MQDRMRLMNHDEFVTHIDFLSKELENFLNKNNLKVDYLVPILRSGAVPAIYIANRLNIVKFAPFQAKHITYKNKQEKIEIIFNPLKSLEIKKTEPVFLVVEGTHSTGKSVELCIDEIYKHFPKAKILYVSIAKYYGSKDFNNKVLFEKHAFNFATKLDLEECNKLDINPYLAVYPWEITKNEIEHPDDLEENIFF